MEIDPKTGLPVNTIGWEDLIKSSQQINVSSEKKRYGKIVTVVSGFDKGVDMKKITKELKNKLACGGTYDKDTITLQGDHIKKIKPLLIELGFEESSIRE